MTRYAVPRSEDQPAGGVLGVMFVHSCLQWRKELQVELDDEEPDREIDFEEQQLKKEEIERLKEESRKAKMKNRYARRFGALMVPFCRGALMLYSLYIRLAPATQNTATEAINFILLYCKSQDRQEKEGYWPLCFILRNGFGRWSRKIWLFPCVMNEALLLLDRDHLRRLSHSRFTGRRRRIC